MIRLMSPAPALLLLTAVPASGQWEPPDDVLQIRVDGDGAWSVRCDYQDRKGKAVTREAHGPRDGRLHLLEPSGGACSYQAASDKPLTIRLKSPLYACTLPAPDQGACQQTFAAGASGEIEVRKRS